MVRGVNDVRLDCQIIPQKFRRKGVIGQNPTDFCGREEYIFRPLLRKQALHSRLAREIYLVMSVQQEILKACGLETPDYG